ncbi:MAG TPA: gamma-glutamyl-gamma-aminobutyrate hydrolase family protein [Solirubrobacteraceae bacterium]|nr:gamma-glutamyl-gamma-aminobutyrate hydrolase family protein [Solirubrobacteraceae bacterium]
MRPVIGICTYLDTVSWGAWVDRAAMVPAGYVGAVQRAGGVAVLLPPDEAAIADPDPVLDLVEGLILAGGVDVGPGAYGAEPHPETDACNAERDAFELALARRALERDIPVLGICRGMQVMNVAAGGTLHQHLPELVGHEHHRTTLGVFGDHDVRLADGSLAARAAGEAVHPTKSHHHQGVDALGEGFVVTGWSAVDELPEAIERLDRRYALGVQWHPEVDETSRLIASLVEEARNGV